MQHHRAQILIVEDEENLLKTLALNLKLENYSVLTANSGSTARKLFADFESEIDLVLLDVMLPEVNGFDLCKEFKTSSPDVPIIFLTAKNQSVDKIAGLKLGADDYIVKPFELEELLLRVNNVTKRKITSLKSLQFGKSSINFETFEIIDCTGKSFTLSKREIGLLRLLTENKNKVVSRDEILEKLWGPNENASSRTIDNYILTFRKYFEPNVREPLHFHSVRGVGYKFTL